LYNLSGSASKHANNRLLYIPLQQEAWLVSTAAAAALAGNHCLHDVGQVLVAILRRKQLQ
jgi:hypothetical protein